MVLLIREKRRGKWRRDCGGFFCSATRRSLQRRERLEKVLYSACAWTHTHTRPIFIQQWCKWFKTQIFILQHSNNTNTFKSDPECCSVQWLHPVLKCHISECCRFPHLSEYQNIITYDDLCVHSWWTLENLCITLNFNLGLFEMWLYEVLIQ